MIKDIVVSLGTGGNDPTAAFAVSVAETFEAHLAGVSVAYDPIVPGAVMGGIPVEFIEAQRAESDKLAKDAITRFEQAAKRSAISYETRTLSTSAAGASDELAKIARRFDLAIVGQANRETMGPTEVVDEGVLFESGRPVIVVPFIQKDGLKLDRVLVCWDASRAATRAVADSMPFLRKAKQVEIVLVSGKGFRTDEAPGADLAKHLARHDLQVTLKRITSPEIDVASTILSYVADSNTDMLVMGGYGHSRLREFVLGGVTRAILESMTVPTLMSH
jgi:nucleotide-binding universal stress UspA family protein